MIVEIQDKAIEKAQVNEAELRREIALLMYGKWVWDTKTAREFCGMQRLEWLEFSGSRKVPIHYSVDDLEQDWETVKKLRNAGNK